MSTKRIFDDMYLFLKQANIDNSKDNMDENGLPIQTYSEITSQYWNLIYKNSVYEENSYVNKAQSLHIMGLEGFGDDYMNKFEFTG